MGQQQLLLLVLGIVIVGLAVVAGINAFSENQEKSTKDAIVNEGMRIATDVQAWRLKPDAFGGGGGDAWPANLGTIGTSGDTPWGLVSLSNTGTGTSDATVTLAPASTDDEATITIPADGGSPKLNTSGGTWSTPSSN
jgi:hypothetical protein